MKIIKLNLGSGPSGLNDWLNYDYGVLPLLSMFPIFRQILINFRLLPQGYNLRWPKIKLVDIGRRFPLTDSSVKYIYCSHVLEHFHPWRVEKILKECFRVLQNGGVMRIVIPDLSKICRIYLRELSGTNFCRIWWGYEKDIEPKGIFQKLSRYFIREHQWHYGKNELTLLLNKAGFKDVKIRYFCQGIVPNIEKLDLPEHRDHSLYLEAEKIL